MNEGMLSHPIISFCLAIRTGGKQAEQKSFGKKQLELLSTTSHLCCQEPDQSTWSSCILTEVWGAEGRMRSQWESHYKGLFVKRCYTTLHIVVEGARWSISSGRWCICTNQNACSFLCWNIVTVLYYIKGEHLYLMVIWVGYDTA